MNKNKKIEAIQGLRGIAALMVFFSHALCMPISPFFTVWKNSPLHFFFDGQIAVVLFVVISGFFYYKVSAPSIKDYMRKLNNKFFRIYPTYVFTLIVGWLLCNLQLNYDKSIFTDWSNTFWQNEVGFQELIKQLTVLWPHNFNLINPPTWYIGLEVRLFILIPILIMLCNTKYTNWWVLFFFVFLFIGTNRFFFAICLCGCITKIIFNRLRTIDLNRLKWLNWLMILVAIFLLNIRNELNLSNNLSYTLQTIGACIVVLSVSLYNYKLLCNRFILWVGNISFEFYLCHFAVLLLLKGFYYNLFSYVLTSLILSLILSVLVKRICDFVVKTLFYSCKWVCD